MNKKVWSAITALTVCTLMFGGCATALIGPQTTEDSASASASVSAGSSAVVAEVNGESIYKDEYDEAYSNLTSATPYNTEEEAVDAVLDFLIEQKVTDQKIKELGYDTLSNERQAEVEAEIKASLDQIAEGNNDEIVASLEEGYTQEDLEAAKQAYVDNLLSYYGFTREIYMEEMVKDAIYSDAFEAIIGDVTPAEAEIRAKYDEYVASDKQLTDADPASYVTSANSMETVYYIPAGVRRVRQVLIMMDEEMQSAIGVLREQGYDSAADILLEKGLADIKTQADEVLSKIKSGGMTFDEAITQHNADTGMPKEGYPVVSGNIDYVESFTEAAMGLKAIGDYTELVPSEYGYHIIEYYADDTQGPVSYDLVKDTIADELKTTKLTETQAELVDQWKSEATVKTYKENL